MDNSLDLVIEYIDSQGGEISHIGLTSLKVSERASLIKYPERPDCIAFSLERHKGILGSRWEPRTPMNAFVTYFPCYLFDPKANHLSCIEPQCKPFITVNDYTSIGEKLLDFSFKIEPIGSGGIRYQEIASNDEGMVTSCNKLMEVATRIIDGFVFEGESEELGNWVSAAECEELLEELIEACRENAREVARMVRLDMEELEP